MIFTSTYYYLTTFFHFSQAGEDVLGESLEEFEDLLGESLEELEDLLGKSLEVLEELFVKDTNI